METRILTHPMQHRYQAWWKATHRQHLNTHESHRGEREADIAVVQSKPPRNKNQQRSLALASKRISPTRRTNASSRLA